MRVNELLPVKTVKYPFSTVGQLANGCTAFLIGRCYLMTVAHCVYSPQYDVWWPGLDFYPGRNGRRSWSPHGFVSSKKAEVSPKWKETKGGFQHDYAIIVTKKPIGDELGWLDMGQGLSQFTAAGARDPPALLLNIAGYPDNKENGSMWYDACLAQQWRYMGDLMVHNCRARGGNSGSPLWVYDKTKDRRQVVGMHIGAEGYAGGQGGRKVPLAVPLDSARFNWVKKVMRDNPC